MLLPVTEGSPFFCQFMRNAFYAKSGWTMAK